MADDNELQTIVNTMTFKERKVAKLITKGEVGAILSVTVKDKNGKVTLHKVQKSESFVVAFLDMLWAMFAVNSPMGFNFSRDLYGGYGLLRSERYTGGANAAAGTTVHSIIVGTGTATPTITDYILQVQIAHGTGSGQLQYGSTAFGAVASDTISNHWTITRDFANSSGSSITVNEIGLALRDGKRSSETYPAYFMVIRDIVAGGVLIPNGQTLTVNYRLIITA